MKEILSNWQWQFCWERKVEVVNNRCFVLIFNICAKGKDEGFLGNGADSALFTWSMSPLEVVNSSFFKTTFISKDGIESFMKVTIVLFLFSFL